MATLEELERIVKINPYAREFYQLALEYQKLGKIAEAKSVLLKGLEKSQGNFQARLLLTRILIAESNFQEAKKQIERVLIVVPDNISANHLAAEISESLGDNESALRYYKVVELFEPDRQGIREKIYELENINKKNEEAVESKKEELSEERFDIPIAEEDAKEPSDLKNEEEKEEEPKKEISKNTLEEEKIIEEINLENESAKYESETISDELKEEKIEESFPLNEENAGSSPLQNGFAEDNLSESDEKLSEEIGEDTLTDLLEESAAQEQIEEKINEEHKRQESEDIKLTAETNEKEEIFEEEIFDDKEEENKEEVSSLSTATLADLYEKQGYPDKAIEIYQHILLKEPDREDIRKRIEKLKKEMLGMETQDDVGVVDVKSALRGKRIEALKEWLRRIREAENV
jgi:Tfp pilus assembly protein PilF